VIGGFDIIFSNNFTITIPSGTAFGDGTLNYGLAGQLTSTNFTIDSTNKYRVYSFEIPDPFLAPFSLGVNYLLGNTIEFNTFGSYFNTELGLYDESGNIIAHNDGAMGGVNGESKLVHSFNLIGKYYILVGGYDIDFSNKFGISIPSNITQYGDCVFNYGITGQLTSTNFTIGGTSNRYRIYSFDIEAELDYIYTTNGVYTIHNPSNYTPVIIACSSGGNSGNSGSQMYYPSAGGGGGASLTNLSLESVVDRFKIITVNITDESVIISTKSTSSATPNMVVTLYKGGNSPDWSGYDAGGLGGVGDFSSDFNDNETIVAGNNGTSVNSSYTPSPPPGGTAALNIGTYGRGADGTESNYRTGAQQPGTVINNPYVKVTLSS
jgi:hypothetical protein